MPAGADGGAGGRNVPRGDAVRNTVVRNTKPRAFDGIFGDGVTAYGGWAPASAVVTATRIEDSARAGLSTFGAAPPGPSVQVVGCRGLSRSGWRTPGR